MGKKQRLRDDLEMMDAYAEALEIELQLAHDDNEDVNRRLGIANSTVCKQIEKINEITEKYYALSEKYAKLSQKYCDSMLSKE